MKVPVVVTLITTVIEAPGWTRIVPVDPLSVVAALTVAAAATYGPTNGPPSPVGAAPAGFTGASPWSATARARSRRPLPVSSRVPTSAAERARRPTMVPLEAPGSIARRSAAAAATSADDADVPVTVVVPPPAASVSMSVPGAPRNVSAPWFEEPSSWSARFVFETPTTPRSPAG